MLRARNWIGAVLFVASGCETQPVNDSYLELVALKLASKRLLVRNREIPGTAEVKPIGLYRQLAVGRVLQAVFVNDYSIGSLDPAEACAAARSSRDLVCIKL